MNIERSSVPKVGNTKESLRRRFCGVLKNKKIVVPLAAVAIGLSASVHAAIDEAFVNTPDSIRAHTSQLIPDYNPEKFEKELKIISDFSTSTAGIIPDIAASGATSIEIPKDIIQSGVFIQNNREAYERGQVAEKNARDMARNSRELEVGLGTGFAMAGLFSLLTYKKSK